MNGVEPMTIPQDVARAKFKAYRANLHRDADGVYARAAEAYEAAAAGLPLLDLANVFASPPLDARGRPRLAIARADRKEVCVYDRWRHENEFTFDARARAFNGPNNPELVLTFRASPEGTDARRRIAGEAYGAGYAPVPMIPADKLPAKGHPREWFILWEVDRWSDRSKLAPPPTDPFLLQYLGGTLYAILAEWDLSPLERAVMAEALRA